MRLRRLRNQPISHGKAAVAGDSALCIGYLLGKEYTDRSRCLPTGHHAPQFRSVKGNSRPPNVICDLRASENQRVGRPSKISPQPEPNRKGAEGSAWECDGNGEAGKGVFC
jgi:hypothetical protein